MQKNITQIINEAKTDVRALIEAKIELFKLQALEKGTPIAVTSVYAIILLVLLCIGLFFLLFCGAFALSIPFTDAYREISVSFTAGFGIMAAIFLIPAIIMAIVLKPIVNKISNKQINKALDKMEQSLREKEINEQIDLAESRLAEEGLDEDESKNDEKLDPIVYEKE